MRSVYYRSEDDKLADRLVLAIALSIAINEIILGVIAYFSLFPQPQQPPDTVVAETIKIVAPRIRPPTPPPTPVPTPKPTPAVTPKPRIALTTKIFHQARPRAAAAPERHSGGRAAPKAPVIAMRSPLPVPVTPPPQPIAIAANAHVQTNNGSGVANGGNGTGGGPGSGTGGAGGSDSGTGGNGTQIGMDSPLSPCGQAWFDPMHTTKNDDGSVYVQVSMRVEMRNGHEASDVLHWYFYYPHEADNPFLPSHDGEKVKLQFPPAGYDLEAKQIPAIALAIKHTRPNGTSTLPDCPSAAVSSKS